MAYLAMARLFRALGTQGLARAPARLTPVAPQRVQKNEKGDGPVAAMSLMLCPGGEALQIRLQALACLDQGPRQGWVDMAWAETPMCRHWSQ